MRETETLYGKTDLLINNAGIMLLGSTESQDSVEWKESVGATNITAKDVATTIKFSYELPQAVSLREIIITDTMQDA